MRKNVRKKLSDTKTRRKIRAEVSVQLAMQNEKITVQLYRIRQSNMSKLSKFNEVGQIVAQNWPKMLEFGQISKKKGLKCKEISNSHQI